MAAIPTDQASEVQVEKAKLVKSLGRFDSVFFILAGMISVETLGQVATYGASTLTWIIILVLLFLVPYGLVVSELGSAYPLEGGPYPWMKRAWGRTASGVGAVLYWVGNPIWIGGLLAFAAAGAWSTYIHPIGSGTVGDYLFKLAFIWITVGVTVVSLRRGKWIPNLGAAARIIALTVFSIAVGMYAVEHGVHGFGAGSFSPTSMVVFLGLVPVLLFSFEGFELPSCAAEEMVDPVKDVPRAVGTAGLITAIAYCIPIFGILIVLPTSSITGIGGFVDAVSKTFTVFGSGGHFFTQVVAIAFIFGLLTEGSSWMMGGDRAFAIAALDGGAPRYFGVFSQRFGTPVRVNVASGFLATALLIAAQYFTTGSGAASFTVVLYLATSTGIVSYLMVLSAGLRLRQCDPDTPRPYRVPFGSAGMAVASILCTLWVLLGTWVALFPGLLEEWTGHTYSMPDTFGVTRMRFEVFTLGTFAVIIAIGFASVAMGRRGERAPAVADAGQPYAAPPEGGLS